MDNNGLAALPPFVKTRIRRAISDSLAVLDAPGLKTNGPPRISPYLEAEDARRLLTLLGDDT